MNDSRLTSLHQTLPTLRLKTEPADLQHYGRDWTRRFTPAPLAIALPATVQEVQAIVRWANDAHIAIVLPAGAPAYPAVPWPPMANWCSVWSG